jgi:beta-N-acetylhexosaminidase
VQSTLQATATTPALDANIVSTATTTAVVSATASPAFPDRAIVPDSKALVEEVLAQMSVEEKLGQLFMVFFDGTSYSPALEQTIQDLHVGGILIFHQNVGPVEELAAVIAAAQETAATTGAAIPLFVGVDHEGGLINRFGDRLTPFPGPMAIAATGSVENARAVAEVMSEELLALGINMNLAPVVDVNNNPKNPVIGSRAFASTPELVTSYGLAMIEGFQESHLIATAKHFPGHGDTTIDSHSALPVINKDLAQLQATELVPFAAAIAAGTEVIMTAHVAVPPLTGDSELPATLSDAILVDLLRDEMGFEGLIAADSLGMGALDLRYGITQTASLAVDAGVDLLMFGADPGHTPVEQYWVFENLLARVQAGELSEARLDESVRRILQAKARHGLLTSKPMLTVAPSAAELAGKIRTPEHLALAEKISEQAVTLVKNDAQLLPLSPDQHIALIVPEFEVDLPQLFAEAAGNVTYIPMPVDPDREIRQRIMELAAAADVIVMDTYNANFYPGQVALVKELQGRPLVVIATSSAYDLLAFPEQETYLTTYNDNRVILSAAVKLLFGQIQPAGMLPVELPPLFPAGFGIREYN